MADWWSDFTTGLGNILIQPQTFGSLMPPPTDPTQRQQMIAQGLFSLGNSFNQAGRERRNPLDALGQGMQDLQNQGAQRGQQQLQSVLLMGKIGEQQRKNQTLEMLSKTKAPEGWSDDAWKAFVTNDPGEAFKVYAATIKEARDRAAIGGMGDFPGMGGPPTAGGSAPSSQPGGFNIGNLRAQGGGFQTFSTPEEAIAAAVRNVQAYPGRFNNGQPMTLLQVGERWAPKGDGANDPAQWARNVAGVSGLPVDQPLDFNDPAIAARFARGVHAAEFGQRALWGPEVYLRGVTGGRVQPAPMPEVKLPGVGTPAPMPQPNFPNPAGPNAQPAPMPNVAIGARPQAPTQPVQFTPQQGAPQPQQAPPADYRSDPVVQEAHQAFRQAQARGDVKGAQEARSKAAERIATLQQQAQAREDRTNTETVTTNEGVMLIDKRTGQVIRKVGDRPSREEGTPREFTMARELRQEFNNLPEVKSYKEVMPQVKAIRDAAPRNTRAADINIVFAFAKLLDPTSVVREGEQLSIARTGGVWETIKGWAEKLNGGGALTPEIRRAIQREAEDRFTTYRDQYQSAYDQYAGYFKSAQLDPKTHFTVGAPLAPYQVPSDEPAPAGQPVAPTGQPAPLGQPAPAAPKPKPQLRWDGKKLVPVE